MKSLRPFLVGWDLSDVRFSESQSKLQKKKKKRLNESKKIKQARDQEAKAIKKNKKMLT